MMGQNQEIDLSLRKLENAFIVRKRATWKEIVGIGIKNKLKGKKKNDCEKNTRAVVIVEDVVVLSTKE